MDLFSRLRARGLAPLVLVIGLTVGAAGVVLAAGPAIQTITPHSADQMTNLDVLRQQIRNYYGDELGTGVFGQDSNYAREACSVADKAERWLAARARSHAPSGTKAIVLDVDDTTLATWNYEISVNWAFTPASNAIYVTEQRFVAVPCMVDLVKAAAGEGYKVFYLTGRGASQEAATLGNLTSDGIGVDAGYPAPSAAGSEDGLFTKPARVNYPQYLLDACATELATSPTATCTTIHYKSATRAHLESLGFQIVGNFGDQFSDLEGGHADKTFKLPNPNYFLP